MQRRWPTLLRGLLAAIALAAIVVDFQARG